MTDGGIASGAGRTVRGAGAGSSPNRNTEVRSPNVRRRHAEMFGSGTPVTRSRNRSADVWSNGSELTQPPAVHGEMTTAGTPPPPAGRCPGCRPGTSR